MKKPLLNKGDWDEVTAARVEDRVACGWTHAHIAKDLGITENSLKRVYGSELSMGASKKVERAYNRLFEVMMEPKSSSYQVNALIWFLERVGPFERKSVNADPSKTLQKEMTDIEKRQWLLVTLEKNRKMLQKRTPVDEDEDYSLGVN